MDDYDFEDLKEISVTMRDGQKIVFRGEGVYQLRDWIQERSVETSPPKKAPVVVTRRTPSSRKPRREPESETEFFQDDGGEDFDDADEPEGPPRTPFEIAAQSQAASAALPRRKDMKERNGYHSVGVDYRGSKGSIVSTAAQMKAQAEAAGFQY